MAYEIPVLFDGTKTATANYSSAKAQFTVVKSTSATTFTKQTSALNPALGILQDTPSSGTQGSIMLLGITKARVTSTSHAAIAVLDKLTCSTAGGVIPQSTAQGTRVRQYVLGRALETLSSNSTGVITMFLTHEGGGSSGAASAG